MDSCCRRSQPSADRKDSKWSLNQLLDARTSSPTETQDFGHAFVYDNQQLLAAAFRPTATQQLQGVVLQYRQENKKWQFDGEFDTPLAIEPGHPAKLKFAIAGKNFLVGCDYLWRLDGDIQRCCLFESLGGKWQLVDVPVDYSECFFGTAVAMDENRLLIGNYKDGLAAVNAGAVYQFVREGDTWNPESKIWTPPDDAGPMPVIDLTVRTGYGKESLGHPILIEKGIQVVPLRSPVTRSCFAPTGST